jgi:DNA-binding transcriptional MerR regulator
MQGTELYTVNEAAKLAGVNPVTVRRYIRKGLIKPEHKNNQYLLTRADLQKIPRKGVSTSLVVPPAQIPSLEPMQDLLAQINKTFVQFSEQNATTAQGIAQEYSRSVRPIVQKVTGETEPELSYETLKSELMAYMQRPIHVMLTNMLLIKKALVEHPEIENMSLTDAFDWFITNLLRGLDEEGINFSEPLKKVMKETILDTQQK